MSIRAYIRPCHIIHLVILFCIGGASHAQTLRVALPDTSVPYASPVLIPMYVGETSGLEVVAAELGVAFRNPILTTLGAQINRSLVATGWSVEDNVLVGTGADTLLIAMSTAQDTLQGHGALIHLLFETADIRRPTTTPLRLRVLFNDGTPSTLSQNGSITLTGTDGRLRARPDSIFPSQPLRIIVDDLDEDVDASQRDTIRVRAINRRNNDSEIIPLIETGVTTGRFRRRLRTQTDTTTAIPADGILNVLPGDTIRVRYIDILNATGVTDTLHLRVPIRYGTNIGIHRYALLALHSMHISTKAQVHSGFVGVQNFSDPPYQSSNVELNIGPQAKMADSVIVSAPRVRVRSHAHIASTLVYTDLVSVGPGVVIGLHHQVPSDYWPLTELPAFQTGTPGSQDITIRANRTETIHPGAYNNIRVRTRGTLTFTGGTYHINNLDIGTRANAIFLAPSILLIKNKYALDSRAYFGPSEDANISAPDILVYVEGVNGNSGRINAEPKAAKIGVDTECRANFFVPNGTIFLRERSHSVGAFIGNGIILGVNADVHLNTAWSAPDFESPLPPFPPAPPTPPGIVGDFDQDGDVDLTDFLIFVRAFNNTDDPIFDLNEDGDITIHDFFIFLDIYREHNGSSSGHNNNDDDDDNGGNNGQGDDDDDD